MKHYNNGNVWGRVSAVKREHSQERRTPYLAITVECPNEMFGNLRTYGRLWGEDKINAFMDYHKSHPGQVYRFQGFFSQYEKDGARYSNYTFFNWQPVDVKEFRAAFVLVGEVTAAEIIEGDGKLYLHLVREGQNGYQDIEEDFEVFTLHSQDIAGISEGDVVQVKGVLRYKEAADYFGGAPEGAVKPYVMDLKVRTPQEETEAKPF